MEWRLLRSPKDGPPVGRDRRQAWGAPGPARLGAHVRRRLDRARPVVCRGEPGVGWRCWGQGVPGSRHGLPWGRRVRSAPPRVRPTGPPALFARPAPVACVERWPLPGPVARSSKWRTRQPGGAGRVSHPHKGRGPCPSPAAASCDPVVYRPRSSHRGLLLPEPRSSRLGEGELA